MDKLKIIVSKTPDEGLEKDVNDWIEKNQDVEILRIEPFHRQFAGIHYRTKS